MSSWRVLGLNLPTVHSVHWVALVSPPNQEYVPSGQLLHSLLAVSPSAAPYVPDLHGSQSSSASFPVVEANLPCVQSSHSTVPTVAENLPAGQFSQTFADSYFPCGQPKQSVCEEVPSFEILPGGHAKHESSLVLPVVAEYFPAAHKLHWSAAVNPEAPEKVPAGQPLQNVS